MGEREGRKKEREERAREGRTPVCAFCLIPRFGYNRHRKLVSMPEGPEVRRHADALAAALAPHPLLALAERPGLL